MSLEMEPVLQVQEVKQIGTSVNEADRAIVKLSQIVDTLQKRTEPIRMSKADKQPPPPKVSPELCRVATDIQKLADRILDTADRISIINNEIEL